MILQANYTILIYKITAGYANLRLNYANENCLYYNIFNRHLFIINKSL
jgi:hypothetical protein